MKNKITLDQFRHLAKKLPKKRGKPEDRLQIDVSEHIKSEYPDVIFTSESSGLFLTTGQAVKAAKCRSGPKLPDMMIFEPRGRYSGLLIELKVKPVTLKDGSLSKDKHVQAQYKMLKRLQIKGYCAFFAVGLEVAKRLIDDYMKLKPNR